MDNFARWYDQDLAKPILLQYDRSLVFSGDNESVTVGVHVAYNGEAASLAGTVSGAVIRSNGTTVPLTGTLSGSDVSVVLTSACFNVPGPIGVSLTVTSGDQKITVLKVMYSVEPTSTDTVVDPSGEVALDVADLIDDIENAVASIPADYSDLLAAVAPTFSTSTAYAAGAYVWYDGALYRFITAHAAGSWTGSDATLVSIGADLEAHVAAIAVNHDAIAPDFDTATAYAKEDHVWYNNALYRFTASHAAGAWVGTDATQVTVVSEIKRNEGKTETNANAIYTLSSNFTQAMSRIQAIEGNVASAFSASTAYEKGDYVLYGTSSYGSKSLYRFTADHPAGAWAGSDATLVTIGADLGAHAAAIAANAADIDAAEAAITQTRAMIAPTETSPAASAHAVGENIIYNGTLYTVIAPIAANDALTVGTNIAAVTNGVSGQVGELKSAISNDIDDLDSITSPVLNLFDKRSIIAGAHYNSSGELYVSATSEYSTQYIPVDSSKTYSMTTKNNGYFCTYNSSKQFIERLTLSSNTNQSFGSGVAYIRISFNNRSFGSFMFVEGATLPADYADYQLEVNQSALPVNVNNELDELDGVVRREIRYPGNWTYYGTGYFNTDGSIATSNSYKIYYFIADANVNLWTDNNVIDGSRIYLRIYNSSTFSSSTLVKSGGYQAKNDQGSITADTLPKAGSKLSVSSGQYVGIAIKNDVTSVRFFADGDSMSKRYIASDVVLLKPQFEQIDDARIKPICYKETDQLYMFIPTADKKHFIQYCFKYVDNSTIHDPPEVTDNGKGWRLEYVYLCNLDKSHIAYIAYTGEWEMAVRIDGRSDFIGLGNHGDEIQTMFKLYIDGKSIDADATFTDRVFNEAQLICKLTMYDPADHETVVGYHTRIDTVNAEKHTVTIENKVDFTANLTLKAGYLFMAPLSRKHDNIQITDTFIDDEDYVLTDCATTTFNPANADNGVGKDKSNANQYTFWGADLNLFGYAKINRRIAPSGNTLTTHISDSDSYNKIYLSMCADGETVSSGDKWILETEFFMDSGYVPAT